MSSNTVAVADVEEFLRRQQALIVHFSGVPPGKSYVGAKPYPFDLHDVIAGRAQGGLSCSAVKATDKFVLDGDAHAFGNIGVILGLTSMQSLLAVTTGDGGAWADATGKRQYQSRPIGMADIEASVRDRNGHNEWVVANYVVLGILAVPPFQYWGSGEFAGGTVEGPMQTNLFAVCDEFAPLPVFSFLHGRIIRSALVDEIYP